MNNTPSVANILAVYNNASAEDMRAGLGWYVDAHNWCVSMAGTHRPHLVARNAGIVAALSPLNGWGNNKRMAHRVISKRGMITVVKGQKNGIGIGANVTKAIAIYKGSDPMDVLKGNKVRAFYATILNPTGDIIPVIDRHAFDIAIGERTNDDRRKILERKGVYEQFANAYRDAAKVAGIGSAQMQAITWLAWRNMHNIKAG